MRRKNTIRLLKHLAFHVAIIGILLSFGLPMWVSLLPLIAIVTVSVTKFAIMVIRLAKAINDDDKGIS